LKGGKMESYKKIPKTILNKQPINSNNINNDQIKQWGSESAKRSEDN
jgi:hypothetical protein